MARVVRHRGRRLVAAPLAKHIAYLKREGVTRGGEEVRLIDAASNSADSKAFAERCAEDRHHFRFIVSPEDATEMADLRAVTRELMKDAERDLGTKLDWVAVDHWNTDNPHIHVLVRGKADDRRDLVISRDYMSQGVRQRAAERVAANSDREARIRFGPVSRRRSRRSGGRAWTGRFGISPTRVPASLAFVPARAGRTQSFAACLSAGRANSGVLVLPSRSGRRNGA
jgi:type IV secretory pathway VirD2 relaxase